MRTSLKTLRTVPRMQQESAILLNFSELASQAFDLCRPPSRTASTELESGPKLFGRANHSAEAETDLGGSDEWRKRFEL